MDPVNYVSETFLNVKEEFDFDLMEWAIKVEGEEVPIKLEDDEKPIVCDCDECESGCCKRMARCTRVMAGCLGQAIKKEEWEGEDEQLSGEMAVKEESGQVFKDDKDKIDWAEEKIKCEDIKRETGGELVKAEVKGEEEGETSMATQRRGSASVDSVIIKFEDDEEKRSCQCEDCGMVKTEEGGEMIIKEDEPSETLLSHRIGEEMAVEGEGSSDDETVIEDGSEDEEDWLPPTEGSLASSSSEEEEIEDAPTELVQEPIKTGPSGALQVRPVADANSERTGPSTSRSQSNRRRQSSRSGPDSHRSRSRVNATNEESDDATENESASPPAKQVRTAKGSKRRRCPHCPKMITNLTNHLPTHSEERLHICDHCGRGFTLKHNLYIHLKTHTGEKPFTCQQCGRAFIQKRHLTVHLMRHSGEKTHQCDQCSSAFTTNSQLISHRRFKHTEERPYRCPHLGCNYAAADKSSVNRHANTKKHRR